MKTTSTVECNDCGSSTCKTSTPVCPDCGALECLCRPRFFAGQLLTEQDLNRLDQYIKKKNRLHNRNQHGWGVVNGLQVLCDPCDQIKVTTGYAIDPCGDDIVVCEDTAVDICSLIRQCRQQERKYVNCEPFHRPGATRAGGDCDDMEEEWVLAIKYKEWPSRGITALRGNTCSCSSGCSCGGCGAGNCSCGGSSTLGSQLKSRTSPAECEPTIICESYCFEVYRKPAAQDPKDDNRLINLQGPFWDRFNCCAQPLVAAIPPFPDMGSANAVAQNLPEIANWCCQFKSNLINYFHTHRNTTCWIKEYLSAIVCPNPQDLKNFMKDFLKSFLQLIAAWAEGIKNCLCLSLMPPPPDATHDSRVPLATVRIRSRDCKILSICNWTMERKLVVTWPAVGYWTGIFNIGDFLHGLLDSLCCRSLLGMFDNVIGAIQRDPSGGQAGGEAGGEAGGVVAVPVGDISNNASAYEKKDASIDASASFSNGLWMASSVFASQYRPRQTTEKMSRFFAQVTERSDKPLELTAVLNSITHKFNLPTKQGNLTDIEAANLPLLLLTEIVAKPLAKDFSGTFANVDLQKFKPQAATPQEGGNEAIHAELASIKEELAALKKARDKKK